MLDAVEVLKAARTKSLIAPQAALNATVMLVSRVLGLCERKKFEPVIEA
jgi:hypothetical protein